MSVNGTRTRAIELLAQGIPQSQVAGVLGVTESAVSQLMADEDFAASVVAKKVAVSVKDEEFDGKLEGAEESALDGIVSRIKFGNLQQQLAAFRILNAAKRRKDSKNMMPAGNERVTNLILPVIVLPHYVMNQQSEIIEVDGKSMMSATNTQLNAIVKDRTGVELAITENKQMQAQEILENVTRSVVRPVRRQTKKIESLDMVDLI